MAQFTVKKAIWFTEEQAAKLEELANTDPAFRYNRLPSENMVVRAAFDLFLSQKSKSLDEQQQQTA